MRIWSLDMMVCLFVRQYSMGAIIILSPSLWLGVRAERVIQVILWLQNVNLLIVGIFRWRFRVLRISKISVRNQKNLADRISKILVPAEACSVLEWFSCKTSIHDSWLNWFRVCSKETHCKLSKVIKLSKVHDDHRRLFVRLGRD